MSTQQALDRRTVIGKIFARHPDLIAVAGLGNASWDLASVGDRDLSFPLWGAMGGAAIFGLGLAIAQPNRTVIAITGDGEQLMGLGGLATIAQNAPKNLVIIVMDNGLYGETGRQKTHTATGTDLAAVAIACGFKSADMIQTEDDVGRMLSRIGSFEGPYLAVIKIEPKDHPKVLPPRNGTYLKDRMRLALLNNEAKYQ